MKNLTIHRPGYMSLPGAHKLPDDVAARRAHREVPAAPYSGLAAGEALEQALARWPLLREIDQSLVEKQQKQADPYAALEMLL